VKLSDKGTRSAQNRVDPLRSQTGLARVAIIAGVVHSLRRRPGGRATDRSRKKSCTDDGTYAGDESCGQCPQHATDDTSADGA
jgi:hypothetical protein